MKIHFYYSLYDFNIESQIELPTAHAIAAQDTQVNICYGKINKEGLSKPVHNGFNYQISQNEFWLNIPGIARFIVAKGQRITIDVEENIDEDSIRAFLLSICFPILLKQRQLFIIPGFALQQAKFGIAFAGAPGNGLSMLQGLFYKRGYSFSGGGFFALNSAGTLLPGLSQLEFGAQMAVALQLDNKYLKPIRPGMEHYILSLTQEIHPIPLSIIYRLQQHKQTDITFTELNNINKPTYLQNLTTLNNSSTNLWHHYHSEESIPINCTNIRIVCINLPVTGLKLQQLVDAIEHDSLERGPHHACA